MAIRPDGAELAGGDFLPRRGFLVSIAPARHTALAVGAELDETGAPVVDGFGRTSVPGLFAIGDLSTPMPSITAAIADGTRAAAAIVFDQL